MHAKLFCKTGQLSGASYTIKDEATIGKGAENSINLDAGPISTKHARIVFDKKANSYVVEDLGSRNGTRIDGARVREKEKLGQLHIITFAEKYDFIFQTIQEEVASTPLPPTTKAPGQPLVSPLPKATEKIEQQPASAQKPIPAAIATPATPATVPARPVTPATILDDNVIALPSLQAEKKETPPVADKTIVDDGMIALPSIPLQQQNDIKAPAKGPSIEANFILEIDNPKGGKSIFALHKGENTIGRISPNEIAIDDSSLSRNHAVITVSSGIVMLKDLGSKNYTFVNRKRITEETEILPGSEITFGVVQVTLKSKE